MSALYALLRSLLRLPSQSGPCKALAIENAVLRHPLHTLRRQLR